MEVVVWLCTLTTPDLPSREVGRRKRLKVELKAAEKKSKQGRWQWFPHGKGKNGKRHSLLTQCVASGADVLLLSYKDDDGVYVFVPIDLRVLTGPVRKQLAVRGLTRLLPELCEDFGVFPFGVDDLSAALAGLLPA